MLGLLLPPEISRKESGYCSGEVLKASEAFSSILARNNMSYNDFHGKGVTGENNGEFQFWKLEKGTEKVTSYKTVTFTA